MALTITGVYPATGSTLGGDTITVSGTDLNTVTTVTVGGTAAPDFEILNAKFLRILTPPGTAGTANIVLGDGSTTVTLTAQYTYAAPTSDAVLTSTLARKFRIDVNTGTAGSPIWTQVRAITTMATPISPTMQDDSDYDSDGWGSQAKTMLAWSITATLSRKVGATSGNYDPGQEKIRSAHDQFGPDGLVQLRWYDRTGGPEAYTGFAHVGWEPQGGDAPALDTVNLTLTGQGKRTTIANPAA
ncbi:hypothetical protein B4N89_20545 [Embleya scabrispora]|uniref:IPT/TIG domain-containing protein n=1 Tax=Embleya scabrispora TaxID=159449 RepID=A0A1T3P219_9ACTN|nr:IPT/TIG domain-containing protein [Embleya scabrispora]OPC83005.1 hypothetical protein B4N89_20545 [Embleya scabrispora]